MRLAELKIKRLALGAEARILRQQEARARRRGWHDTRCLYYHHRMTVVRPTARAAHLAHAVLTGRRYAEIEDPQRCRKPVPVISLAQELRRFGPVFHQKVDRDDLLGALYDWISGGDFGVPSDSNREGAGSLPAVATS